MSRPSLEVADIFRGHGPAWRRANAGHVSFGQLKVMSAIESCRTAALGGHVARCEKCSHTQISYNSCRNRHCPKCQGAVAKEWLAAREADLLPVPYYRVVFTLPAAIADIAYQNKAVIYDLPGTATPSRMGRLCQAPVRRATGCAGLFVTLYPPRRHRQRRLIAFDRTGVTSRWKDYRADGRDRQKVMTLATAEFIRRFLIHVLPQGFHRIRHYGLFGSSTRADNTARARRLLDVPEAADTNCAETDGPKPSAHPCPCCGGRMVVIEKFQRGCSPGYRSATSTAVIRIDTS